MSPRTATFQYIYVNDVFYITESTNVHVCDSELGNLINKLEHDSVLAIECFDSNYMKLNEDKCHLLGVTIDKHLKF